ncbi:MAG: cupin domain-containing protein [wastewater metagenome]|nr:cupin domain-containing protein [Candidatus Loosdrechtia aerotolerans]
MGKINLSEHIEFSKEKYVSKILFDSDAMRMVLFCLEKGQEVPPHTAQPQVVMLVISGKGSFLIGDKTYQVKPDSVAVCKSMEAHGIKADEQMVVLASIIPRP